MKPANKGCGIERAALQFGVELDADEPRMVGALDDLGQLAVGRHAGEDQPLFLERVAVVDVDLVAVAVALGDVGRAILLGDLAVVAELRLVGPEPHGAAEIGLRRAPLQPFRAHPLGDEADHRLRGLAEFGGRGRGDAGLVPRRLDARHLHAEADAEEGDVAFAGEFDRGDLALAAALAKAAGDENAVHRLQFGDDVGFRMLEQFGVDPLDIDLDPIGDAAVDQRLA